MLQIYCKRSENSFAKEPVPKAHSDTICVAFYNVQNLFDLHYSGTEYNDYKPGVSNWDRDMMQKKLENIASVIMAMRAEVIGLCEVENNDILKKLQRLLENHGCSFKYSAIADGPVKTNTCPALISRYPLKNCRGIAVPLGGGITRNILEADAEIGKETLKIFVNHWPSKMNPESYRIASAKTLSLRLKKIPAGTDYILIGDFNSDYDDFLKITTSGTDDARGNTGVHSILETVYKSPSGLIRYITEDDFRIFRGGIHYDLWLELPEYARMSHFYQGNKQTPDHILIPGALFDSSGISYVDNSFKSFIWNGKLLSYNRPYRWQIFKKKGVKLHAGKGYSDHLPIYALFVTGPFSFDTLQRFRNQKSDSSKSFFDSSEIYHKGWMLCNSDAELFTDTTISVSGRYCLCIRGNAQKNNECIARIRVDESRIPQQGLSFNIQGSGRICLRSSYNGKKWKYLDLQTLKGSKNANYPLFVQKGWKQVKIKRDFTDTGDLELELRTGKGEPFCLWID